MSKFYCNICEEEVTLQNGKCPKCKTNWENIINEKVSEDSKPIDIYKKNETINFFQEEYSDENVITEDNIKNNIDFFLTWAGIVKFFMIVIGIIIAIVSFVGIESTNGYSLILLVFSAVIIFAGIIFENSLKWKAYMLHINMKKKK